MQTTDLPLRSLDLPRLSLFAMVRKCMPYPRRAAPRNDACAALERLALSSPHLLLDLGFEADSAASGGEQRVWRRGAFVVTIRPAAAPRGAPRVEARRVPAQAPS